MTATVVFHDLLTRQESQRYTYDYSLNYSTNLQVYLFGGSRVRLSILDARPGRVSKGAEPNANEPRRIRSVSQKAARDGSARLRKIRTICESKPGKLFNQFPVEPARILAAPRMSIREIASSSLRGERERERHTPTRTSPDLISRLLPLQFACVISPCHLRVHRSLARSRVRHFQPFVRPATNCDSRRTRKKKKKSGKENQQLSVAGWETVTFVRTCATVLLSTRALCYLPVVNHKFRRPHVTIKMRIEATTINSKNSVYGTRGAACNANRTRDTCMHLLAVRIRLYTEAQSCS